MSEIVELLQKAYNAEIETVINYLAASVNLDGVRAQLVRTALEQEITDELQHARQLADRLKILGASIPGSQSLRWTQDVLQPPADSTDLVAIIEGVVAAEEEAIETYKQIVEVSDGVDPVTQDLAVTLLGDEEGHRREFLGFLREYQS